MPVQLLRESELRRIIDTVVRVGKNRPARKKSKFTWMKSPMR